MTTTELERLARWLEAIGQGKRTRLGIYFTERDLEFTIDEGLTTLAVHACEDFAPPWGEPHDGVTLSFALEQIDVRAAAQSIRSQLANFPDKPPIDPPGENLRR